MLQLVMRASYSYYYWSYYCTPNLLVIVIAFSCVLLIGPGINN